MLHTSETLHAKLECRKQRFSDLYPLLNSSPSKMFFVTGSNILSDVIRIQSNFSDVIKITAQPVLNDHPWNHLDAIKAQHLGGWSHINDGL